MNIRCKGNGRRLVHGTLGTLADAALMLVLAGVALVFAPLRWLYPSRMERLRAPTIALGVLWAVLGLIILAQMPDHSPVLAWLSLFYPAYYTIGSAVYHLRTT